MSAPTHFHGLKLLTHCGGGAFGEVWYCEDISGRKLAVKILSKKKLGADWERELRGEPIGTFAAFPFSSAARSRTDA